MWLGRTRRRAEREKSEDFVPVLEGNILEESKQEKEVVDQVCLT